MADEDEICCNACGFEASFVPEGMLPCQRCGDVQYCSIECLKWDWESGGHAKTCVDKRPEEVESSSSEDDKVGVLPGATSTAAAASNVPQNSSFESDNSMDVSKLFGLAPGSFDGGKSPSRYSSASDDTPKGDVKGQKNFWENKMKKDSPPSAPAPAPSPAKSKGNASKLAAFFESQTESKKTSEKMPASMKRKPPAVVAESEDSEHSMGDDDFNFAGKYTADDPLDDSFDFMDTSVQTSGLKSIVEESDSWSEEEPDLEGSWRSRTPFESASDDGDPEPVPKKAKPKPKQSVMQTQRSASATSMLGDSEHTAEEEDNLWEAQQAPQEPNYVETDDFYEEESMEEEDMRDESMQAEEGSMEEEEYYDEEEEYTEEYTEEHTEDQSEEVEESQDDTIENSDRTPDDYVHVPQQSRKVPATNSLLPPSLRVQKSGDSLAAASHGLSSHSSHSEPAAAGSDKDDSNESARKRRSIGTFSLDSSSRGAASLLDFRQVYSEKDSTSSKNDESSSRLKDFRAAYNGPNQEESVSSTGELLGDLFAPNTALGAVRQEEAQKPAKQSNQALKTSLNKALRDFEKLYGSEAAQAAVARLTEAVGDDKTVGTGAASSQGEVAAGHNANAEVPSVSRNAPTPPDQSPDGEMDRPVSPSSWAMPSGVSVSSGDTDEAPYVFNTRFSGKQPRSQSMPLVGRTDSYKSMKFQNSLSSWGMTGASLMSGGNQLENSMPDLSRAAAVRANPARSSSSEDWLASLASSHSQDQAEKSSSQKPIVETVDGVDEDEESIGNPFDDLEASNKSYSESNNETSLVESFNIQPGKQQYKDLSSEPTNAASPPRYMQYRDTLAKQHYGTDTVRKLDFDDNGNTGFMSDGDTLRVESNEVMVAASATENPRPRYMEYRTKLATAVDHENAARASTTDAIPPEKTDDASGAERTITMSAVPSADDGSRFQQYRTTLAKRVHQKPEEDDNDSFKKAKTPGTLGVPASVAKDSSTEHHYQAYRSHLAKAVSAAGQERTDHLDLKTPTKGAEKQAKLASESTPSHPLTEPLPTSSPVYQQYRNALAQAIRGDKSPANEKPVTPVVWSSDAPDSSADYSTEQAKIAAAAVPMIAAGAAGASSPRYAKYRTALKDRVATPESTSVAMLAARTASAPEPDDSAMLEEKLTNFLAKNEKGKKLENSWSDPIEVPTSPKARSAERPSSDLVESQSKKIAAAIASSQLYLGQKKGAVQEPVKEPVKEPIQEPRESRLDPAFESRGIPEAVPTDHSNRSQPIDVTCHSSQVGGRNQSRSKEEEAKEYRRKLFQRNKCYVYGLLLCLLVAMPLGIGLGLGLTGEEDEDRDLPIDFTVSPTLSPTPGLRGTSSPTSIAPGQTLPPSPAPSTLSPTTATAFPTPLTWSPTETPTALPSASPTTALPTSDETVLFNLLASVSSDNGANIQVSGSPQNFAFSWLAGTDPFTSWSEERIIQRYALATLYFGTEGLTWSQAGGWLTDVDECIWFGTLCDGNGALVSLDLGFNGLMGSVPPEIGILTGLRRVDISGGVGPGISGPLPPELAELVSLEIFTAQENAISGALPESFSAWSNLRILNLNNNDMTGPLPTAIGNFVGLTFLDVSSNGFSGRVPEAIGSLVNLVTLKLGNNAFTSLPASFANLVNLSSFDASFNSLSGPLFDNWSGLVNLRDLDLHSNTITGSLPASVGSITGLLRLDFSDNRFSSVIPSDYGNLPSIFILRLNSNLLTGNIPVSFGNLQFVAEVRVDDNDLTGSVPNEVCDSFEVTAPKFYLDCAAPEISCPPGLCCTYCCTDGVGCECVFEGTSSEFLC